MNHFNLTCAICMATHYRISTSSSNGFTNYFILPNCKANSEEYLYFEDLHKFYAL
jgi:hypothetical protein